MSTVLTMTMEQRRAKVGDAILLERAELAIARNMPTFMSHDLSGNAKTAAESLRILARWLRTEGETGEPAY